MKPIPNDVAKLFLALALLVVLVCLGECLAQPTYPEPARLTNESPVLAIERGMYGEKTGRVR